MRSLLFPVVFVLLGLFLTFFVCGDFAKIAELVNERQPIEKKAVEVVREPDQLDLPADGGLENWKVNAAPYDQMGRSVSLGKYLNVKRTDVWGVAVAPEAAKAIVTYKNNSDPNNKYATRAMACDLRSGQITAHWSVEDLLAPFAIHPSGSHALLCRRDWVLSERETLYLVDLQSEKPETVVWRPLVESDEDFKLYEKESEIAWVSFVGDRIVTLNNNGKIHIWNLWDLSRVAVFPGVVGKPCLTPDGTLVAFLTDDQVALLDPSRPEIIATHRMGEFPNNPVLAFDQNGRRLAIAGKGESLVLELDSMTTTHCMINQLNTKPGADFNSDLAWAGDYLYSQGKLFQMDSPIPVWRVEGSSWQQNVGRSLWAVVRTRGRKQKDVILRSYAIPIMKIEKEVELAYRSSDFVALRPGDPVQIDVAGIPSDKREEVLATLTRRLKESGFRPVPKTSVILLAWVDKKSKTCHVKYTEGMFGGPGKAVYEFTYERQPANMQFIKQAKVLWSASDSIKPPGFLQKIPKGDVLPNCGGPDYSLYEKHRLPEYLRGYKSKNVAGTTTLLTDGMK